MAGYYERTPEIKQRLREGKLGSKNPNWKGDNICNSSLHIWIRNNKPKPEYCENCHQTPPHDVANISGKYLRDIADYKWLCRKCHMVEDGRLVRLQKYFYTPSPDNENIICTKCGGSNFYKRGLSLKCVQERTCKQCGKTQTGRGLKPREFDNNNQPLAKKGG